ncbi:helix-turn-helix transcriptional regulator [Kineococcus sp. SYSU DK003]|uniref:helix-turn-helix transcriptional regulator n=1 Tax=Kineococcus sp. SYSU DK003 TaxID=3383124 RepID=UPI003D7DB658
MFPVPDRTALPLVGRDAQWAQLQAALAAAREGAGAGVLVQGEAGIGKTTLVTTLTAAATAAGFAVLQCRGVRGAGTGFAGLHELLHPVLDRIEALPPRQRATLEVVFGIADGTPGDRLLLTLATVGLLEEVTQDGPVLLVVEDLHWLDRSTAEIVTYLPARVHHLPVLLVVTTRPDQPDFEGPPTDGAFPAVLPLGPLEADEARMLVAATAPGLPTDQRDRVLQEAFGNPLALTELATSQTRSTWSTALRDRLPVSRRLEQAFLGDVEGLPAGTRTALLVAAAGQDASRQEVLEALHALDLSAQDLGPAERARLIDSSGDRYEFRHPLIGSALYDAAGTLARSQAHGTLATVIRDPARAVLHRAAATMGWNADVAAELATVADQASRRGAKAEAATAWRQAAALTPDHDERAGYLASAAETARQSGASAEAAALLAEARAITAADQHATIRRCARTDWILSMTADHRGRSTLELLELAAAVPHTRDRLEMLVWAATKCHVLAEPDTVRAAVHQALLSSPPVPGSALQAVGLALVVPGTRLEQASFDRFRAEAPDVDGILLNALAFSAEEAGNLTTAELCWTAGVELHHDSARTSDEVIALCGRATPRAGRGDLVGALADAEQAHRLGLELGLPVVAAMASSVTARARAWRGERDRAVRALEATRALPGATTFARVAASTAWAAGVVALLDGRHADALADLAQTDLNGPVALWAGADLAEPAARTGRPELVHEWARTASAVARSGGSAHLALLIERSLALVADDTEAEPHFEQALAHGRDAGAEFDLARTRLHYGEWLRRSRRITEAREQLSAALGVFEGCAALPLAERARTELRAAGASVSTNADQAEKTVRSLTAQELLVARLAAQGLSNKEIADQVYLSHRTVGSHLSHAFAKLQVSRRSQLAAALGSELVGR